MRQSLLLITIFISLISILHGQGTEEGGSSVENERQYRSTRESVTPEHVAPPGPVKHKPAPVPETAPEVVDSEKEEGEEVTEEEPAEVAAPEEEQIVEETIPEASQTTEKEINSSPQEESTSSTVVEEESSSKEKSCSDVKKSMLKLASKENVKKAVAAGLGMWGASVGVGWAMHKVAGE